MVIWIASNDKKWSWLFDKLSTVHTHYIYSEVIHNLCIVFSALVVKCWFLFCFNHNVYSGFFQDSIHPKRRRTQISRWQLSCLTRVNQTDDISQLASTCMAADISMVKEKVRQCGLSGKNNSRKLQQHQHLDHPSWEQWLEHVNPPSPLVILNPGIFKQVDLWRDPKAIAKMFANKCI